LQNFFYFFVAIDAGYRPRNPEQTVLYQVVAEELETFLRGQKGS